MAENAATADAPASEEPKVEEVDKETATKPLKMSFADWKKSKEAKEHPGDAGTTRNGRKPHKNENNNKQQGGNRNHMSNNNNNKNINNNISFPPLSRPPPLPFPLMSMGYNNFGPGPGPCGPQQMMPPACNMGPGPRNHRPLQPPPFWEDMMSPQHRPPPIQPPMPKCPSLWNLVPKEKQTNQRQNKHNQNHSQSQNNQPNKKYKTGGNSNSNNSNNSNNKNSNNSVNNASVDAALMPPPPPPGGSGSSNASSNDTSNSKQMKKKTGGGTFVQIDGKWIQRPEAPPPLEEAPPGTKEDRQRQWREYRQAMKPFKNREFHNWKRTVQRLSKLPRDQLDEKQLERLQKAEEYIGAHKAMLTIKHAEQWVQQGSLRSEPIGPAQGQIYVRKSLAGMWHKTNENAAQRVPTPLRKQTFGTGRAIKGGIGNDMPPSPGVSPIGQFSDIAGSYFSQPAYSSNPYGLDMASSSNNINNTGNSSSFYSNYTTSSFIKGGTLLPP